ncbi:Lsr2 family protein [Streptomyces morookaense]|uniref:histone-like nucleoid-structuring protein Lsr2 n=1 Tax=Streptomyces morookaense TaxID=1970 RepID=UPI0033E90872
MAAARAQQWSLGLYNSPYNTEDGHHLHRQPHGEESNAARNHTFSVDGVSYEIDLGPDSYDQMLQALAPFTKAARKQGKGNKRPTGRVAPSRPSEDTAKIRAWAKENGYDVNDRGRVPAEIREAFESAPK